MGRRRTFVLLSSMMLAVALAIAVAILLGLLPRWAILGKPFTLRYGQTAFILGTKLRVQYASCEHLEPESQGDPSGVATLLATLDGDRVSVGVEHQGEPVTVHGYRIRPEYVSFFCLENDADKIKLVVTQIE